MKGGIDMDSSKVEYLKQFKGGSMAKTFLIKKGENLYVRKEVEDESSLGLKKLEKQVDWILELEDEVAEIFPKVIEKNFGEKFGYYDMTYHQMPSFKDYLIEKGIGAGRLSSKGFASTQPVVKNAKTEEDHQKNRRTTFQVLKNN